MSAVISVEGLWKEYRIGGAQPGMTFRESLVETARWVGRGFPRRTTDDGFWALKDVSFKVAPGEVVGIIGRNGAGKSTLLKILSRITAPTRGRIEIRGRVASLLEVGTGFHPELTGRENIRLNGAILGMSSAELRSKFDEIVEFSGVERFIDTPVKRYSSGMQVRLAFAVAAHLEPEILVIDEVLAVGDAEFQKKCLGKMKDVAGHGRTVLFVSHNMAAVRQLCSRAVTLSGGQVAFDGDSAQGVAAYATSAEAAASYRRSAAATEEPHLLAASVLGLERDEQGKRTELVVELVLAAPRPRPVNIDVRLRDSLGSPVGFATSGALDTRTPIDLGEGETKVVARLDVSCLAVGGYSLSIDITKPFVTFYDRVEDCLEFHVGPEHWHNSLHPLLQSWQYGSVLLEMPSWKTS